MFRIKMLKRRNEQGSQHSLYYCRQFMLTAAQKWNTVKNGYRNIMFRRQMWITASVYKNVFLTRFFDKKVLYWPLSRPSTGWLSSGADLWGGGGGRGGRGPPFQSVRDFFWSKYTIILSFCKQSVGAFDFFS